MMIDRIRNIRIQKMTNQMLLTLLKLMLMLWNVEVDDQNDVGGNYYADYLNWSDIEVASEIENAKYKIHFNGGVNKHHV